MFFLTRSLDYYPSRYGHSAYYLGSHIDYKKQYWVDIVDIKNLRIECLATAGNCTRGDTVPVLASPQFCYAKYGASCTDVLSNYFWNCYKSGRVEIDHYLSNHFHLFHYPMCMNNINGMRQRSYIIVDESYRVVYGVYKLALAASLGASRIEVIMVGNGRRKGVGDRTTRSLSSSLTRPLPCTFKKFEATTPASKVSLGLRVLEKCDFEYIIMKMANSKMFPSLQKPGGNVDVLLASGSSPTGAVECLRSIFPYARVTAVSLSQIYVDILQGGDKLFYRFNIHSELPFAAAHPLWQNEIFAHSQVHLSPLNFLWKAPSDIDEAAIRYFEWRNLDNDNPLKIKHLQWIANHPTKIFPLPQIGLRNNSYRTHTNQSRARGFRLNTPKPSCKSDYNRKYKRSQLPLRVLIFSRDRASQLLLLLGSMESHVDDWRQVSITAIISASEENFVQGYIVVQRKYPCIRFKWDMGPGLFRKHTLDALSGSAADEEGDTFTLLLVDDNIFVRQMAFSDIVTAFSARFLSEHRHLQSISIRMHPGISHTYTRQMNTPPPNRLYKVNLVGGKIDSYMFVWNSCDKGLLGDWAYPVSIASDVYRTKPLRDTLQSLLFTSPNQMESQMYEKHQLLKTSLKSWQSDEIFIASIGLTPCVVSMPFNRVQSDFPWNLHDTSHRLTAKVLNNALIQHGKVLALPDRRTLNFSSTNSVPISIVWKGIQTIRDYDDSGRTTITQCPTATLMKLADFLGTAPEDRKIGYEVAIQYEGNLESCILDMCRRRHIDILESRCFRQTVDALDRYSPFFPCMRQGWTWAGEWEVALFHSKFCLGAEATTLRHFKALGLWGWAASICEHHQHNGSLEQFIEQITSPTFIKEINTDVNYFLTTVERRPDAIRFVRWVSAVLLYVKIHHPSQSPRVQILTSEILAVLSTFEYSYSSYVVAAALYCLSAHHNPRSLNQKLKQRPFHYFSDILKLCQAKSKVLSKNEAARSPLLEGGQEVFSNQTLIPLGRAITRGVMPACSGNSFDKLLIGVISKPENIQRRKIIRDTWGSYCHKGFDTCLGNINHDKNRVCCEVVFVVGATEDETMHQAINKEYQNFGDILWITGLQEGHKKDFVRKIGGLFAYALHTHAPHCPSFILRTDDDVYLKVNQIMKELKNLQRPLFWGYKNTFEPVQRAGKYEINAQSYGSTWYAPFLSGGRYVLSRDLLEILLVYRPLSLSTSSFDDVDISRQLSSVVEFAHDPRFYDKNCDFIVENEGTNDFLACETNPGQHKNDSTLQFEFTSLFQREHT